MKAASEILQFKRKRVLVFLFIIFLAIILPVVSANFWIVKITQGRNYSDINEIPSNEVGLLLGTSKYNQSGQANLFFGNRIEAAASLYHAGKIKHIIVSGDNSHQSYNEPRDMRRALVKKGVPEAAITLDFAGFRTLDSVVRCKKVFGQEKITVISQKFHNQRALFIADHYGIDAIGFSAFDPPSASFYPTFMREILARFKAVLDIYVIKEKPKFLGKEEKIEIE